MTIDRAAALASFAETVIEENKIIQDITKASRFDILRLDLYNIGNSVRSARTTADENGFALVEGVHKSQLLLRRIADSIDLIKYGIAALVVIEIVKLF
jgi:hypothetical protein